MLDRKALGATCTVTLFWRCATVVLLGDSGRQQQKTCTLSFGGLHESPVYQSPRRDAGREGRVFAIQRHERQYIILNSLECGGVGGLAKQQSRLVREAEGGPRSAPRDS